MSKLTKNNLFIWQWTKAIGFFSIALFALHWILIFDKQLFSLINGNLGPCCGIFFYSVTHWGDGALVLAAMAFLIVRPGRYLPIHGPIFIQGILGYAISGLVVQAAKNIWQSPRPAGLWSVEMFYTIGPVLKNNAFPSGHSASAMALTGLLMLYASNRNQKMAWLALGMLAVLSRVVIGVHWPADIWVGGLIGYSTAHILYQWRGFWEDFWKKHCAAIEKKIYYFGWVLFAIAIIVFVIQRVGEIFE